MTANVPKRAIHFDFHTMPGVLDVGAAFDETKFADALAAAHVEYVTVFARCNVGFAYYPTKIGVTHPGLQTDLLGRMVASCHARGIQVAAYFNVRLSHEEAIRHPEWCRVRENGQIFDPACDDHFFRDLCINTGYGKHLKAMVSEVLDLYPVDGIFLDCMAGSHSCRGSTCVQGMIEAGLDPLNEIHRKQFAKQVADRFRREVEEIVTQSPRNARVFFNGGTSYCAQPSHIEIETLPAGGWGYEELPWQLRYARTLGKPILAMTGRFQEGWGDFGGLLPTQALLYDCLLATSLGASCSIGDHLHPRGYWEPAVQQEITEVFSCLHTLDPWTKDVRPLTDILVLEPLTADYPQSYFDSEPLKGARRMLCELHHQFDVSNGSVDFSQYKVILLPDHTILSQDLEQRLQNFLQQGGSIISSGHAGMKDGEFPLSQGKLHALGNEIYNPSYTVADKNFIPDSASMPVTIYKPGVQLNAAPDVEVWAALHRPYFNLNSWYGQHVNLYTPPDQPTGRAALIRTGQFYHFSFPVFSGYFRHATLAYRQMFAKCLGQALPNPLLTTELPGFVHIAITEQPQRRMVHLLAYIPEMRGGKVLAQEPITIPESTLSLRLDDQKITRVYTAPDNRDIPYQLEENSLHITSPAFTGYQLLVIE